MSISGVIMSGTRMTDEAGRQRPPDGSLQHGDLVRMLWKGERRYEASDSYAIAAIMERMDGWNRTGKAKVLPIYGKQRIYRRNG